MNVLIDIVEQRDVRDAVVAVCAKARIDCSPSDGFNSGLIKKLERDLGPFVEERLAEALKEGRKPRLNCERFKSAEEAWDAYDEWVESYRSKGKTPPLNEFGWLFAPAGDGNA